MLNKPLNITKFCQQKRVGTLRVQASDLLDIEECQSDFEITYQFILENTRRVLQIQFDCVLSLLCQSCWVTYQHLIKVNSRLALTEDTSEETHNELSALGYEVMMIEDNQYITMLQIIKEEIYLQIPHIPRCPKHNSDGQGMQIIIDENGVQATHAATATSQQKPQQSSDQSTNKPFEDLLKSLK